VSFIRARSVDLEAEPRTRAHLDGEPFGDAPLHVELAPLAIDVAAPSVRAAG
jgi:diacylglycerol kinase family enzyme